MGNNVSFYLKMESLIKVKVFGLIFMETNLKENGLFGMSLKVQLKMNKDIKL
jgi:hypothetical protein